MLKHLTLDQLYTLGLYGMAKAFSDLAAAGNAKYLPHANWLALLLDRETSWRRDKRLTARLRAAKLRQQASVEDVDYRAARGLDRALFQKLSEGEWMNGSSSTTIHAIVDARGHPSAIEVTPGHLGDVRVATALISEVPPGGRLAADAAYDSEGLRRFLLECGTVPVIPNNPTRKRRHPFRGDRLSPTHDTMQHNRLVL
jgi:hypothetical protein